MGFATFGSAIASAMISNAVDLSGDFSPVVGVLTGIAAFGMLIGIFARFVRP